MTISGIRKNPNWCGPWRTDYKVNNEQVVFNIIKDMKYPKSNDDCFAVRVIEHTATKVQERSQFSTLEDILTSKDKEEEVEELADESASSWSLSYREFWTKDKHSLNYQSSEAGVETVAGTP